MTTEQVQFLNNQHFKLVDCLSKLQRQNEALWRVLTAVTERSKTNEKQRLT